MAEDSIPAQSSTPTEPVDRPSRLSRRLLLGGVASLAVGGAVGGVSGIALGYKFRHSIDDYRRTAIDGLSPDAPGRSAFFEENAQIRHLRKHQSLEDAVALRAHYAKPVFGQVDMWTMIENMGRCADYLDKHLLAASQLVHVKQTIAAMMRAGVTDPNFYLLALLHDVGKVVMLNGARPEHILGGAERLFRNDDAIGLDNLVYRFSHAELIYSRIKDHVPEAVAWTARYHNIDLDGSLPFMTAREREFTERYLRPFREFDTDYKSFQYVPSVNMARYRELIAEYLPKPVLF